VEEEAVAMLPTLFSINGLSTELRMDRRTIARKMAQVPSDGRIGKGKAWFLTTAMRVLGNRRGAPVDDDDMIERNPVDAGICVALIMVAVRAPEQMALAAIQAGAPPDLARAVFENGIVRARSMVSEILDELEVERHPGHSFPAPQQTDWEALAG
jgi:hypothetical protein